MSESNFRRFVEVGRVVLLKAGPSAGKIAVIAEIIDHNRAPHPHPPSLSKLPRAAGSGVVKKELEKQAIVEKWEKSSWATRRAALEKRRSLNDFGRFEVMLLKKQRRDTVRKALKTKA
ncbi:ribosomal protein L14-domain-containing protein [Mucidula mucida]|nr:ribosomal protein L14-domain-containing protein [Mucidula mucida]